jgi:hypothetical protein
MRSAVLTSRHGPEGPSALMRSAGGAGASPQMMRLQSATPTLSPPRREVRCTRACRCGRVPGMGPAPMGQAVGCPTGHGLSRTRAARTRYRRGLPAGRRGLGGRGRLTIPDGVFCVLALNSLTQISFFAGEDLEPSCPLTAASAAHETAARRGPSARSAPRPSAAARSRCSRRAGGWGSERDPFLLLLSLLSGKRFRLSISEGGRGDSPGLRGVSS